MFTSSKMYSQQQFLMKAGAFPDWIEKLSLFCYYLNIRHGFLKIVSVLPLAI